MHFPWIRMNGSSRFPGLRQSIESVGCTYIEQRAGQKIYPNDDLLYDEAKYNGRTVVQRDSVGVLYPWCSHFS